MNLIVFAVCLLATTTIANASDKTTVLQTAAGWQIENRSLRVLVYLEQGKITVLDKRCGYLWKQPEDESKPFRNVQRHADGLRFDIDLPLGEGKTGTLRVTMQLPPHLAELHFTAESAEPDAPFEGASFLAPLILDTPHGALAIADYSNGHLYPLDLKPFPAAWNTLDRMNMPWVGVCDTEKGFGYAMIIHTADDGLLHCRHYRVGEREVVAPTIIWWPQKGRFAYPRRFYYHFVPSGGYVALAKAYRAYAKQQGLVVTLSEKAKRNPHLKRLFGAADVWGVWGVDYEQFIRQARAADITKLLLHGTADSHKMQEAVKAGFLTSEYDNYTDVLAVDSEDKIDSIHDILPDSAVLKADGTRMEAWRTMEGLQYMKRCPALWVRTAQKVIPRALQSHPFLARFIDVTTAEALYECYDPKHPLTRSQKRECGQQLLSYVRSLGLVVGGEHGIWWAVPYLDYIEGMMSSYQFSWPAGHLIRPQSKEQSFTDPWGNKLPPYSEYEKWGIGHEYRIPLWELVFHDCVVSTWYWGDATDWLIQAAPENMSKKDVFNILYGTIPLLWLEPQGAWHKDREAFLRTYRITSKLHEAIATAEMLSHEFVTPDRSVQRTRFSDGTVVVVNFGNKPYTLRPGTTLPQYGFYVRGPRIRQSRLLIGREVVTVVQAEGYWFKEKPSQQTTLERIQNERLRLSTRSSKSQSTVVDVHQVVSRWDKRTTLVYATSQDGVRTRRLPHRWLADGMLQIQVPGTFDCEILCAQQTRKPDIDVSLHSPKQEVSQGTAAQVKLIIRNHGMSPARGVNITLYADVAETKRRLWQGNVSVPAQGERTLTLSVDTSKLDGKRELLAIAQLPRDIAEICVQNNRTVGVLRVRRDLSRWDYRRLLRVEPGSLAREDEPVVIPLENPPFAPESVRIYEVDEQIRPLREIPAQCDRVGDGQWELVFIVPGRMEAGQSRRFMLCAMLQSGHVLPPPLGSLWCDNQRIVTAASYCLSFKDGVPREIAAAHPPRSTDTINSYGRPFISKLVLSSAETGWTEEQLRGSPRIQVQVHGAVRTIVQVTRSLAADVTYTKRYTFYPRFFDVEIEINQQKGVYSRAFYSQEGEFIDSGGVRSRVDGRGEAENVMGKTPQPRWYAVYAPQWAHACLAVSPMDSLVYWDSGGHWGGIGFNTSATKGVHMRYVVLSGADSASFAEEWYLRTKHPARVVWETPEGSK